MKHLLSICLLLIGLSGKAQFFQSIYGGAGAEHLTSGHNVVVQPQFGHLMSGDYNNPAVAGPRLMVVRTDAAGLFPAAPFFSNLYQLNDPAGNILTTGQNKIIELNSGAGYAVCGVSTSIAGVNYVYLLILNPAGGVVAAYDYLLPAPYVISNIHTAISQNAAGTMVYITGHANNGVDDDYYVMKIATATGNVIWSGVYNMGGTFDYSSELIESPFAPEVVLVGGRSAAAWGIMDAFITRLNANNGAHLATNVYGAAANHDYFRSIRVSNNPMPAAGYIVGGATNARTGAATTTDMWTVKFNAAIAMLITTVHDHPVNINSNQVCLDVIERVNMAGVYEYYAAGTIGPGVFSANLDIQVCKLGPGLIGVPGGIFNYGGVGAEEGFNIDINNGAVATGLSTYGKTAGSFAAGGLNDFYLIKSYFNGVSGCNEMFFGPASVNQPFALVMPMVTKNSNLVKRVIAPIAVAGPPQAYLCFAMAVAGGNNARVAPVEEEEQWGEFDMDIYPNPGTSTEIPRIRIKSQLGAEAHVSIYDIMGRKCYESAVALYPGYTNFSLEEAMQHMAKGMYTVLVSDGKQTKAERLMIQ